ncbi:SIR2 family protein [Lysinibacillus sp. NPDC093692]|uniref:SIR2 family protein n=1 Tax=Lysinibacillus sp. NPDC093692 TaxID=3390578 RepID=UPI003CFCA55E
MQKRITCLLGAGAALEIGGPTSIGLTKEIISESFYLQKLSLILDDYYGKDNYNFEDLLHLIETFLSYQHNKAAVKKYKPVLGAFINMMSLLNFEDVMAARRTIYTKIWDAIDSYNNDILTNNNKSWYVDFWSRLNNNGNFLDIITLNYDNTIQCSLNEQYSDGFIKVNDTFSKISLDELYRDDLSKVINLHGSILFGDYSGNSSETANLYVFEDDFHELYKYSNYKVAREKFFYTAKTSHVTQSGEVAEITPIITGLRKADKLIVSPYNAYHHYFYDAIRKNSGLLIVGYSFGDSHVNNIIEKITALHGEKRKVVVITYLTPSQREPWYPDHSIMMEEKGWLTTEALFFYSKAAKDYYPFGEKFEYNNPIKSKDGRLMIFLEGFKQAVENHGDEIIEFLMTD